MDLMAHLPWRVYHDQEQVANFQRAWGQELDVLIAARDDYYQQMRPGTATWGLALFEREYGLVPDPTKGLEKRRALWRAKRRGRGTTTTAVLKQTTELVTGFPAEVTEFPELDYFQIWIHSQGQPMDIRDVARVIEEIKPAHLGMVFGWRATAEQGVSVAAVSGQHSTRHHGITPPEICRPEVPLAILSQAHTRGNHRACPTPPPRQCREARVYAVPRLVSTFAKHTAKGVSNYG